MVDMYTCLRFHLLPTVADPVAPKPHSQAVDTETGIFAGLPIATELRSLLVCDLKTIPILSGVKFLQNVVHQKLLKSVNLFHGVIPI